MSDQSSSDRPPSKIAQWIHSLRKPKNGHDPLVEALEEWIEEIEESEEENPADHAAQQPERALLANILDLREMTVHDILVPRADVAALEEEASQEEIIALLRARQFSRMPVYRETLDEIIGVAHIKDIALQLADGQPIDLKAILRELPIVSPAMPVLDLLQFMRDEKKHMVVAVDEFGGTDGLVTINDIIETVVGEVDDEFDTDVDPQMIEKPDGTILADARIDIEDLEEQVGPFLNEYEREEIDTISGLVFSIAGRVPARGEVLHHTQSGLTFEILDADRLRVNRVRIKKAA